MAKSGIYAFGVIYQTKVVYVYQDKIGHVEKGKISIWIHLSIFRVAVNKEDINIDYNNNYLTISATRNNEHEEKKDNYIRRERSYGSVSRGFYINNVNKEAIKAKFDNGVLNIELPKKELTQNNSNRILIE